MMPKLQAESELTDGVLVGRLQHGDLTAFAPLLDRHLVNIRSFVALKVPVAHLVDELTHETFVFAYQNIARFEAGTAFRPWLRAIAWNLIRAELQRFSREQANQTRFAQQWLAELDRQTARGGDSREADFLEQCMREIPAPMVELLNLKYRDGRGAEEIAATLERSVAWVRTVLFRVRQQLKHCIEQKLARETAC
jgi:RNA polymerase sigma-70 factor (ECF subfamily)